MRSNGNSRASSVGRPAQPLFCLQASAGVFVGTTPLLDVPKREPVRGSGLPDAHQCKFDFQSGISHFKSGASVDVWGQLPTFADIARAARRGLSALPSLAGYFRIDNPNLETLNRLDERLGALVALRDGWDGDDAPRPTADALRRANNILAWADENNIDVTSIDPDVLGGVAIFMHGRSLYRDREVWFSVKNDRQDTLVASEFDAVVWHSMLTAESRSRATSFLKGY